MDLKARVKDYPVEVNNYSGSWADGSAFCALVHSFFPDAYSWDDVFVRTEKESQRRHNFKLAFDTAEYVLKIAINFLILINNLLGKRRMQIN